MTLGCNTQNAACIIEWMMCEWILLPAQELKEAWAENAKLKEEVSMKGFTVQGGLIVTTSPPSPYPPCLPLISLDNE